MDKAIAVDRPYRHRSAFGCPQIAIRSRTPKGGPQYSFNLPSSVTASFFVLYWGDRAYLPVILEGNLAHTARLRQFAFPSCI